jgi:dTDP-4-dehydrorhamnose 3,5-epimerase
MKITHLPLSGAHLVELEPVADERGFFARAWCAEEFRTYGLNSSLAQCSISFNKRRGTLRGLHYQAEPYAETKLIRCTAGAIYDVVLDMRPASDSYGKWFAVELTAANRKMLYVPEGLAHGFQTLSDDTEVFYQISVNYHPESGRGVRWNDPLFGIEWPIHDPTISRRDQSFPDYKP